MTEEMIRQKKVWIELYLDKAAEYSLEVHEPLNNVELFKNSAELFMRFLMEEMYKHGKENKLSQDTMESLAHTCGTELRELVGKYTGIDTHKLYE